MVTLALILKELQLLLRDWHGLLLLFVMPIVFILVMSLALQNSFTAQQRVQIDYYLVNDDGSAVSQAIVEKIESVDGLNRVPATATAPQLADRVQQGRAQFLVHLPKYFGQAFNSKVPIPVRVIAAPDVMPAVYQYFNATLKGLLGTVYLDHALSPLRASLPSLAARMDSTSADDLLRMQSLYQSGGGNQRPSSVQQNVPAWLLFAMFFIAIPISTTWMSERRQGTDTRLTCMGLSRRKLMLGKLVPYLAINLLQVALMLGVGVWLMPVFGAKGLVLGHAPVALAVMALAASFAAVSFGLLVASCVSTSEQATIFTGVANLLMAAVGGVMVPRFVMPQVMQTVSQFSPMAWGLDGFLDIFLRQGHLAAIVPEAGRLIGFGLICLILAIWRPKLTLIRGKQPDNGQGPTQT